MIIVRNAAVNDAQRLTEIYDHYVRETAVTFEYRTPTSEEFRERMERTMVRYPYLVIADGDDVLGYAYAGPFKARAAYDWSCELTIYLDPDVRGRGLGRMLYEALENALRDMGILNLYACIGYPETEEEYLTRNSSDFHAHLGFETVGRFHKCGYKFGRWYDMIWMEKMIGEHGPVRGPEWDLRRLPRSIKQDETEA